MVTEFYNQETDYESFLAAAPSFICNNLGMGMESHKVHHSDCSILHRAGPAKTGLHTSVRKACSRDLNDLVQWLTQRFGPEGTGFTYCQFCSRT